VILESDDPASPRDLDDPDRDSESSETVLSEPTESRQLQAQIAALAARQAEIEHQLRQLALRESRLTAAEEEFALSRSRFEAEQQPSAAQPSAPSPNDDTAATSQAPSNEPDEPELDATDVLRRLQAAGIWRETGTSERSAEVTAESITTVRTTEVRLSTSNRDPDDDVDDSAAGDAAAAQLSRDDVEIVRREETRSETTSLSTTAGRDGEEEDLQESIDRYMERLLERSRTAPAKAAPAPKPAQPAGHETHEPSVPRWSAPVASSATTTLELEPIPQRKPLKPARTPERPCDLAAMRELANASAKAHLALHARDERRSMLQTKVSVFLVSLVSAVFLLWISPRGSTPWCGGIVSLLIAGFWGLQIAVITGKLTIDAQGGLLVTRAREKSSKLAQRLRRAK
jgi:hypothetical protein